MIFKYTTSSKTEQKKKKPLLSVLTRINEKSDCSNPNEFSAMHV